MSTVQSSTVPIPTDRALQLCEQISSENRGRWYSVYGLWCWGCARFTKSASQRCWTGHADNRGCTQVNQRFDRQNKPA